VEAKKTGKCWVVHTNPDLVMVPLQKGIRGDLKTNVPYSLPGALTLGASLLTTRARIVQRQVLDNESVGGASKSSCSHWYERCAH
jgi:hypothetical protein